MPPLAVITDPESQFSGTASNSPPAPLAFSTTNSAYLYALWGINYGDVPDTAYQVDLLGMGVPGANFIDLPSGVKNYYGLPIDSVRLTGEAIDSHGNPFMTNLTFSSGGSPQFFPNQSPDDFYLDSDLPSLTSAGYYFASQTPFFNYNSPPQPMPGSTNFSTTNVSPPLITSVGQSISIGGWSKLAVANGYSGVYGYLEQYFSGAYLADASGNITTNQTGILSDYGDFFPTQAGLVYLKTMSDGVTSTNGFCPVNVIKLQLDVDHDGVMNTSFTGPDNTSPGKPFVFWANQNFDRNVLDADDQLYYDDDVSSADTAAGNGFPTVEITPTPDCNYTGISGIRQIPCIRDLEDFTRLWVIGVSNCLGSLPSGSTVTLSWGDVGSPNPANPTIDLFKAADSDGGMGYLTNAATATNQINQTLSGYVGRVGPGTSIQLNACLSGNCWKGEHFIWCGVSNGTGGLTLTIADSTGNVLAQTTSYIQIVDIKQLYERWTVGDNLSIAPTNVPHLATDNFVPGESVVPFQFGPTADPTTPYILYVHGWNMTAWDKDCFAQSAFKRMYWQGYQGRFGSYRWPTGNNFTGGAMDLATNRRNYDSSEFQAWNSAVGLSNLLAGLNAKYPGHVYMLAHSMGNVVAGEGLRLSGTNQVVNTYVGSQAAVPAHTYDNTVTNTIFSSGIPETPNIYTNWFTGNIGAVGNRVSFFNTNDFALANVRWQLNQRLKPDQSFTIFSAFYEFDGYPYNGTQSYTPGSVDDSPPWTGFQKNLLYSTVYFNLAGPVTNRYEVMAFAAQARSTALGATPRVGNVADVDLQLIWPSDTANPTLPFSEHFYHSAQFRGDYWQQQGYWRELLSADAFGIR